MAHRRAALRFSSAAVAYGLACLAPARAAAFDAEVTSETAAQGYQLRNAWGDPVLSRRRFLQTLGMQVTNIGGDSEVDPAKDVWITFRMRMRLDADFGVDPSEVDSQDFAPGFVPGLQRAPIDLMYGYLDVRNLARGMLSLRLGRQYVIDPLGWWSFDGALMRVELPVYLAFETYGGFEQRGGFPMSTPRFERDGVWRGDRTGLDANTYPSFLERGFAPAYGFAVESFGLPLVHGRVAYRKVWNSGEVATNPFPTSRTDVPDTRDGLRISQERVGASLDALSEELGAVRAGVVYDLPRAGVTSWYGTLDAFASDRITFGADVDRIVPTFDGDSIWSWFASEPTTTAIARGDVSVTEKLRVGLASGIRWVDLARDGISKEDDEPGIAFDLLGRASARYRIDDGSVGLAAMRDSGERGRREGVDVFGDQWLEERLRVSGRVSVYDWRDELRPDRSATSFGYVLGGGYRVGGQSSVLVEWEHDTNRLVGQRYRVLALMQVLVNR